MIKLWLAICVSVLVLATAPLLAQVSVQVNFPGSPPNSIGQKPSKPQSPGQRPPRPQPGDSNQTVSNKTSLADAVRDRARKNVEHARNMYSNSSRVESKPAYPGQIGPGQWPGQGWSQFGRGYGRFNRDYGYGYGYAYVYPATSGLNQASYYAGGRSHHANNWRFVNIKGYDEWSSKGMDYRQKLYYDRLSSKDFQLALNDLAAGVFGAILIWPDEPGLVANSYALGRLFSHLEMRLTARLAYANDVSYPERMAYGQQLVYETLEKLVDGITIEPDRYLVRFRLSNGGRSPWVNVPVVFSNQDWATYGQPRTGAFYYQGQIEQFEPSEAGTSVSLAR